MLDDDIACSDFVARLREITAKVGSASALAKRAHISQSGLQRYLNGGEPTRRILVALAEAADVSLLWLITGQGERDREVAVEFFNDGVEHISSTTLVRVPLQASGVDGEAQNLTSLAFCYHWLATKGLDSTELNALAVRGNSMEPTIRDGDTVLINVGETAIVDGSIYAIRDGSTVLLKRIHLQLGGKLKLLSDNAQFSEAIVDAGAVNIVGRVVWRGSFL